MILGINTSTVRLGVALFDGESVVASATFVRANAHDELLAPLCRDLVARAGMAMDDLDAVAVSAGPGSFTGLRIGMAAAKGFALALNLPLVAVPTHDAAAESVARRWPLTAAFSRATPIPLAVCIDARRDELYLARYTMSHEEEHGWRSVEEIRVAELDAVPGLLAPGTLLAGDGAVKVSAAMRASAAASGAGLDGDISAGGSTVLPDPASVFDAGAVARLGARLLAQRGPDDAASCEPLYVQEFLVKQAKNPFLS